MRADCRCDDLPDGTPVDQHIAIRAVTRLARIHNQDAPIMTRTCPPRLGQCGLNPVGYVQRLDGTYVIELEDPWGYEPKPQDHHFTPSP